MDKKYNLGVVCGRFGHEHLGHVLLFDTCLSLAKKTLILVGSAQESKTLRNPFSIDTRINIIKNTYPNLSEDTLMIRGLNDLTNEHDITADWGRYVKSEVEKHNNGKFADLMVYGNDESRGKWFAKEDIENTAEHIIPRSKLKISATELRGYLLIDDKENWKKMTSPKIHHMYNELRNELLDVPIYKEIFDKISKTNLTIQNFLDVYKIFEEEDKLNKIKSIKKE